MKFKIIEKTPLFDAFSELGKRIFLPEGIIYWSDRAKKEAELNGTIGSAYARESDFIEGGSDEWLPCYLSEIRNYINNLHVKEVMPYASISGLADIRTQWKKWIIKKALLDEHTNSKEIHHLEKFTTLPVITAGLTNGIYLTSTLFLNPGEFIISPNKRWGNYDNIISHFIGAKIKSFEFFKNDQINLEGLKDAIKQVAGVQNKIVLILNIPNNPTGYVPSKEEARDIVDTLNDLQQQLDMPFIILVDDAYEPYIYREDVLQRSLFYDLHELKTDVIPIKIDGISKELLLYGGRIGFLTFGLKESWISDDEQLEMLKNEINNKLEGMIRSTTSNSNQFYQAVVRKIFEFKGMDEIIAMRKSVKDLLEKRYRKINQEIFQIEDDKISLDPNSGGFFLFMNLKQDAIKATDFADHLLKKYKVGVIPIEKPDENINGIRIAYCSIDIDKIPEFVKRIRSALKDY
ncbi:MAG: aminotransferase class I/II-fold pyridoxal phosphate-dependent enzyme [Promethearchaeota archaeon]